MTNDYFNTIKIKRQKPEALMRDKFPMPNDYNQHYLYIAPQTSSINDR